MSTALGDEKTLRSTLDGLPPVDFAGNLRAASAAGSRTMRMLREIVSLRGGPGRLAPQEYFYFRLWDPALAPEDKRCFVGKLAQRRMHLACNDIRWHAATNDKLLFYVTIKGAGLPVPELLAVVHPTRRLPGALNLRDAATTAQFLREQTAYPLFAKPIDGMYSLGVLRAEQVDATSDEIVMHDDVRHPVDDIAADLVTRPSGYLIQRVLRPHPELAARYGDRLWSVRLLVLLRPQGPEIARAVCKIPTGMNVADNYWRPGNILGAVELATGSIRRTVRGTGKDLAVDMPHPDTGAPLVGTIVPDWQSVATMTTRAAQVLAGVRTQSWDVALTDGGPVLLEVNWGGDLNLAQLAWGKGVLDDRFQTHLRQCGYRI